MENDVDSVLQELHRSRDFGAREAVFDRTCKYRRDVAALDIGADQISIAARGTWQLNLVHVHDFQLSSIGVNCFSISLLHFARFEVVNRHNGRVIPDTYRLPAGGLWLRYNKP